MVTVGMIIGGFLFMFFVCILASASGAGGGSVFVPILLLVFQKDFVTAVSISQIAVFGNSISQLFLNIGKTHPHFPSSSLIYWELVIILEPAMLGGGVIGSILSKILPASVLYIIAFLILSYAIYISYQKGIARYYEELACDKQQEEEFLRMRSTMRNSQNPLRISSRIPSRQPSRNQSRSQSRGSKTRNKSLNQLETLVEVDEADDKDKEGDIELEAVPPQHSPERAAAASATVGNAVEGNQSQNDDVESKEEEESHDNYDYQDGNWRAFRTKSVSPIEEVPDARETLLSEMRASLSVCQEVIQETFLPKKRSPKQPEQETDKVIIPLPVLGVILLMWFCYAGLLIGQGFTTPCSTGFNILEVVFYVPLTCGSLWGYFNARNLGSKFDTSSSSSSTAPPSKSKTPPIESASYLSENKPKEEEDEEAVVSSITKPQQQQPQQQQTLLKNQNQGSVLRENALFLSVCTFCIGIICALLGIGGGELLSPMMLHFHLIPQVVSATSGTLSFWNSMALAIKGCVQGKVSVRQGFFALLLGLIGGFIGRKSGLYISWRYNRSSFLVFSLVALSVLSALYYIIQISIQPFQSSLNNFCKA